MLLQKTNSRELAAHGIKSNEQTVIKKKTNGICTCTYCDQLWFKCSVVKWDPNKYKECSPDIVESCFTDFTSVNDTEWICITCNSSLKTGRLPSCSKDKKMGFPYEPKVLNLTSLEE